MSPTMARQGGQVQLEQSDMRLALNMAKMAKEEFSHTVIKETQKLIKTPVAQVREEKKRDVVFPGHNKVNSAIETNPAMVQENQTDGCLPCQNGPAKNLQTRGRRKGTAAPPPRLAPQRPGRRPARPDDTEKTQSSEREGVPPGDVYIRTPLPSRRFSNLDPYAKDRMRDKDLIPDLLTAEGPSTG